MVTVAAPATKTLPVVELFGPTIQGEGALAGLPTHFVRFGGCDYLCSWCDSLHAVLPAEVRANARKLTADDIVAELRGPDTARWVTLSGGNPALFDLGPLVAALHEDGRLVAVETQGSRWRDWLATVDCLTVSPKPPSSGMTSPQHDEETSRFLHRATAATEHDFVLGNPLKRALKIVVFDDTDYEWARDFIRRGAPPGSLAHWPAFLSAGTDPPDPAYGHLAALNRPVLLEQVTNRYRWLCERVAADPAMADVRVLPQLHVLAWSHARGV